MRGVLVSAMTVWAFFGVGCASTATRLPASFKPKYDSKIVRSLTTAAINHVLFQVDDGAFRDVPSRQIDQCKTREAPTWSQTLLDFLALMDRHPELYNKFSMVEFRRGDRPSIELTKDIDGLSTLTLFYGKSETFEKITDATQMPCAETAAEYLGRDLVVTSIRWPTESEIKDKLSQAPDRAEVGRFNFNPEFLVYLAERQAILKIKPEVAFERNYRGEFFLTSWLENMATEIKNPKIEKDYINYWFKEIADHSTQAKSIQFFGLRPEGNPSVGVQVDTAGKLARKMNGYQEATYMFMSYRPQSESYVYGSLEDLNKCLQSLTGVYRNPLSLGSSLDREPASFLAPDYSCALKDEEKSQ
jgi:hypothetical protein